MPNLNLTTIPDVILEKTTPKLTAQVTDANGVGIPASSLLSLKLTQYSMSDPLFPIINTRDGQDVLNANGVTVDASGNLVWQLVEADSSILDNALGKESHRAVFAWTWNEGGNPRSGKHIIEMLILNLERVA